MKYATVIMSLAVLNVIVIFSGLPMGWKKMLIVAFSLVFVFIGWVLRAAYRRKMARLTARAQEVEGEMTDDMDQVADQIAHDVTSKVEHEIDVIQGQKKN